MAGDWIKLEHGTPDKHEITVLSRLLGVSRGDAFLLAVRWWIWLDNNTQDGRVTLLSRSERDKCHAANAPTVTLDATQMYVQDVDNTMHCPGFGMGLAAVGWLEVAPDGRVLSTPNFDRHNGETAKSRALSSRRQRNKRGRAVVETPPETPPESSRECHANSVTNVTLAALPREEKSIKNKRASVAELDVGFAEFWLAYPRSAGKQAALTAWRRLKPDDDLRRRVIAAVLASKDGQWKGVDEKYIPHAATYINGRRWEDEAPSAKKAEERTYL